MGILKKTTFAAIVFLTVIASAFTVYAETYGDYEYTVTGSEATITRYIGSGGEITIPNTINGVRVTKIGDNAFSVSENLTGNLVIPEGITEIGTAAFKKCGFDGNLTIPSTVTKIGSYAFYGCSGFTGSLTIPDSVTSIDHSAFSSCSGFSGNLVLPDSLTYLGAFAFIDCSGLTGNLTIPKDLVMGELVIGGQFSNCSGFTSLTIQEGVATLPSFVFVGCSGFKGNLVFPDSITNIGAGAFADCSGFTGRLTIPENITTISSGTFRNCKGFSELVISPGVTKIDSAAFAECSGLTGSLTIPENVTDIGEDAFRYCIGLTGISVDADNPNYTSRISGEECNGLFSKDGTILYTGCKSTVIPLGVTTIKQRALSNRGITDIEIPSSVTTIESYAFYGCSRLEKIINNSDLETCGGYIFGNCDALWYIEDKTGGLRDIIPGMYSSTRPWKNRLTGNTVSYIGEGTFVRDPLPDESGELKSYIVTFDTNKGTPASISQNVTACRKVIKPSDPEKPCCRFTDWYTDKDLKTKWNFDTLVISDITLYAGWEEGICRVIFKPYEGIPAPVTQFVKSGETVSKPTDPEKTGYIFTGWYENIDQTEKWDFDTPVMTDVTLHAGWKAKLYTVSFNANEGTPAPEPQRVEFGKTVTRPVDPQKNGYDFIGWYTNSDCTVLWDFESALSSDMMLYARWAEKEHTVLFNANGGTPAPEPQRIIDGNKITKPVDPQKSGYEFTGWYTNADCNVLWDLESPLTFDMTLYAGWEEKEYTVTVSFNANGGTPAPEPQRIAYGNKVTKPVDPQKSGYEFTGWYVNADCKNQWYFGNTIWSDMMLYAGWREIYSSEPDGNEGDVITINNISSAFNLWTQTGDFEQSHDYIYLTMEGSNINPYKVWPMISGATLDAPSGRRPIGIDKYVYKISWRDDFKDKLEGYSIDAEDGGFDYQATSSAGKIVDKYHSELGKGLVFSEPDECHVPVYAIHWNDKTKQLEAKAASFMKDGSEVSLTVKEYNNKYSISSEDVPDLVAKGSAKIESGKLIFKLKDNNGDDFGFYTEYIIEDNGDYISSRIERRNPCLLEFCFPNGDYEGTFRVDKYDADNLYSEVYDIFVPDRNDEYTVTIYEIGSTSYEGFFRISPEDIEESGSNNYGYGYCYHIQNNDILLYLERNTIYDIVVQNSNGKVVMYERGYISSASENATETSDDGNGKETTEEAEGDNNKAEEQITEEDKTGEEKEGEEQTGEEKEGEEKAGEEKAQENNDSDPDQNSNPSSNSEQGSNSDPKPSDSVDNSPRSLITLIGSDVVSYNGVRYYLSKNKVRFKDLFKDASEVTSSDEAIAKVNKKKGVVQFKKNGATTLTSDSGEKLNVMVFGQKCETETISVGEKYTLPEKVLIETNYRPVVNKASKASVSSETGVLTALKKGTVKLNYTQNGKTRTVLKIKIKS